MKCSQRAAAFTYYCSRRHDEALATVQNGPQHQSDAFLLGDVLAEKGMYKDAINEFLQLDDSPHKLGHLGNAYARAGQVREARKILAELIGYVS